MTQPDVGRRFTDQEVALVLHRAAEIEARRAESAAAHGLTLRELQDIAKEIGLRPEVLDEAVAVVQAGGRPRAVDLLGPTLSTKIVRGVRGTLDEGDLQGLVRVIEEQVDATGTVTEALGTVRWTSVSRGHKFDRTTQVSLTVKPEETQIQVVQRYPSNFRMVLHLLPTMWSAMLGAGLAASSQVTALAGAGIALGAGLLGLGIGRTLWRAAAGRSARETRRVANEIALAAADLVRRDPPE